MPGASARYSCLHAPVETVTPPRQTKPIPFRFRGFRKSPESSISIGSVFLSNSNPLRWASSWLRTMAGSLLRSVSAVSVRAAKTAHPQSPSSFPTQTRIRWALRWGNDRERFRKYRKGKSETSFHSSLFTFHFHFYSLTGSGYSTPKVSTVTFFMTWGIRSLSL